MGTTLEYVPEALDDFAGGPLQFQRSLAGVAAGPGDVIHACGDDEVRVIDAVGRLLRRWPVAPGAACLAVGRDGRVYLGRAGGVDVLDGEGKVLERIVLAGPRPAAVTAVAAGAEDLLIADATTRRVRRHDLAGRPKGEIGGSLKNGGFMLPNRALDADVGPDGTAYVTDPGRHRVTVWSREGELLEAWGRFGMKEPQDFVGCCNPMNLAVLPGGRVATAEKVVPRIKVFEKGGKLLAVIGPERFDPKLTSLDLAVDSRGRIIAADPARRRVQVFAPRERS